jgi:hypothetical protein
MTSENQNDQPVAPKDGRQYNAARQVEEAMKILPKKRFPGCSRGCLRNVGIGFLIVLVLGWWMLFRDVKPKISKETHYITEPRTADGKRVDYYKAVEELYYPPEMQTDRNGYRMIVRALGPGAMERGTSPKGRRDTYRKLGLPTSFEPTMTFEAPFEFIREYVDKKGLSKEETWEMHEQVTQRRWTLDDLPMMEPWLEENGPFLDLLGQALQKPVFAIPYVRDDDELLFGLLLPHQPKLRSFARALTARAHYRIGTGDIDGAIDDILTLQRLGRKGGRQGFFLSSVIGIAIEGIARSIGIAASPTHPPTAEQLRRLRDGWNNAPPRQDFEKCIESERYQILDTGQAMAWNRVTLSEIAGSHVPWIDKLSSGIGFDWNLVMKRVNENCDTAIRTGVTPDPNPFSPGWLTPHARSELFADHLSRLFIPAFGAAKEAFRRSECSDNFHQIALAMLLYEREHGTLPPAWTEDDEGNRLHSWRVLLLPYLGQEELYQKIRLEEPWDSEHNRRFHEAAIPFYQCPSAKLKTGETTYEAVVGPETAFPGAKGRKLESLGPFYYNAILVVDSRTSGNWMSPETAIDAQTAYRNGINGAHAASLAATSKRSMSSTRPGGMNAALSNGSALFFSETIDREQLEKKLNGTLDPAEED